jgi:hypothetical protein
LLCWDTFTVAWASAARHCYRWSSLSPLQQNYTSPLAFATVYAGLGDKDQAFRWLDKAFEERSTPISFLKLDAIWDPVRADARFASLVQRIGP